MLCSQKKDATRIPDVTGVARCKLDAGQSTRSPAGSIGADARTGEMVAADGIVDTHAEVMSVRHCCASAPLKEATAIIPATAVTLQPEPSSFLLLIASIAASERNECGVFACPIYSPCYQPKFDHAVLFALISGESNRALKCRSMRRTRHHGAVMLEYIKIEIALKCSQKYPKEDFRCVNRTMPATNDCAATHLRGAPKDDAIRPQPSSGSGCDRCRSV
ncbi:MAG: hypothetical protein JWP84_3052 [Tardiphaga sp.]|jgi:hypothetical protein|nr:hypothetical protein [Tardiphaga sp.]